MQEANTVGDVHWLVIGISQASCDGKCTLVVARFATLLESIAGRESCESRDDNNRVMHSYSEDGDAAKRKMKQVNVVQRNSVAIDVSMNTRRMELDEC